MTTVDLYTTSHALRRPAQLLMTLHTPQTLHISDMLPRNHYKSRHYSIYCNCNSYHIYHHYKVYNSYKSAITTDIYYTYNNYSIYSLYHHYKNFWGSPGFADGDWDPRDTDQLSSILKTCAGWRLRGTQSTTDMTQYDQQAETTTATSTHEDCQQESNTDE
ncbi:hypothetical protein EDB89DRAFT_1909627 [Lactarius sanguifluus]|nr:hypothetical protein EDB89DRAFT_1909627 [Lactarius sanguifluus]